MCGKTLCPERHNHVGLQGVICKELCCCAVKWCQCGYGGYPSLLAPQVQRHISHQDTAILTEYTAVPMLMPQGLVACFNTFALEGSLQRNVATAVCEMQPSSREPTTCPTIRKWQSGEGNSLLHFHRSREEEGKREERWQVVKVEWKMPLSFFTGGERRRLVTGGEMVKGVHTPNSSLMFCLRNGAEYIRKNKQSHGLLQQAVNNLKLVSPSCAVLVSGSIARRCL